MRRCGGALAELGALAMRVPEDVGGMGLGLFDAALLMEEAGRTLASGPLAETLVAVRVLAELGGDDTTGLLGRVLAGETVLTIALADITEQPRQWIAGGQVAEAVIARNADAVVLVTVPAQARPHEDNLATTPLAEIDFSRLEAQPLASGEAALATFAAGVEEWKLLIAAALAGLSRKALELAAAYAGERKAFGQLIGSFQGISHPLADRLCDVDGARFLVWKAIRDVFDGSDEAGPAISLALWWACDAAATSTAQALHTFGGYGLTTEYDIYLYNLRAKAWPLVLGDPQLLIEEAGRRLYAGERAALPAAGEVPIDFELGDEARAIVAEIDAFFANNVTPEMREKFHYSWEGYVPEVHKLLAKDKLLFTGLPEELSGRDIPSYAKIAAMGAFEKNGYNTPAAKRRGNGRDDHPQVRQRGAQGRGSAADHQRRSALQPRLLRARRRFGRVRGADQGHARRQRLADRRHQDVHQRRQSRGLCADAHPHQPRCGQAQGTDDVHRAAQGRGGDDPAGRDLPGRAHQHHLL